MALAYFLRARLFFHLVLLSLYFISQIGNPNFSRFFLKKKSKESSRYASMYSTIAETLIMKWGYLSFEARVPTAVFSSHFSFSSS